VARHSAAALQALVSSLPAGVTAAGGAHYNETVLSFADQAARDRVLAAGRAQDIFAGIPLEQMDAQYDKTHGNKHLLVATTEMIGAQDVADYMKMLEAAR